MRHVLLRGQYHSHSHRQVHAQLNRLITSRLPLALPPHAATSELYAQGLRHFAHVYLTFESLWQDLQSAAVSSPGLSCLLEDPWVAVTKEDVASPSNAQVSDPKILRVLGSLRPHGLERSRRLRRDIAFLTGLTAVDLDVQLARYPGQRVQDYAAHIRKVVMEKPHVLVAYAWVMYMAIFSGGRWIRDQLESAGEAFWTAKTALSNKDKTASATAPSPQHAGLSFFYFDGDQDGEDIKADFKQRLQEGEDIFTPQQRQDIIDEANEIFRFSILLVSELDELLQTPKKLTLGRHRPSHVTFAVESAKQQPTKPQTRPNRDTWLIIQATTGLALVVSCVSWYAYYSGW